MSDAPERIWLQWFGDGAPDDPGEVYIDEVTWQDERIFDGDIEYVRKDKADALAEAVQLVKENLDEGSFDLLTAFRHLRRALAAYKEKA